MIDETAIAEALVILLKSERVSIKQERDRMHAVYSISQRVAFGPYNDALAHCDDVIARLEGNAP